MLSISQRRIAASVALSCLFATQTFAGAYSENDNHHIWQLRLAAKDYAAEEARKNCDWTPASPVTYADEIPSGQTVSNQTLLLKILAMARLDQNARAIYKALSDEQSRARVREVDAHNLSALKNLVSTFGFPTPGEVGETGVNAMMLLVAHMDTDKEFQESVAIEMDKEVTKGTLSAMYPMILRAIRPQISSPSGDPNSPSVTTSAEIHEHPSKCYNSSHQKFVDSYIRSRYKESN